MSCKAQSGSAFLVENDIFPGYFCREICSR